MSTELRVEQIPASGTIPLSPANFFFLISATGNVNVRFQGRGTEYGANGVNAGLTIGRVEQWTRAEIRGAPGTVVTFHYGDAVLREDITDQRTQIATIAGIAVFTENPSGALADTPAVPLPNAATTPVVAANLARRRVTISNPSTAAGSFFIRSAGGGNNLMEVQPGMSVELKTSAAVSARNDSGGALSALVLEET